MVSKVKIYDKPERYSKLAITSLFFGIIAVLSSFTQGFFVVYMLFAIILGISGLISAIKYNLKGKWLAIAGLVLGLFVLCRIIFIFMSVLEMYS